MKITYTLSTVMLAACAVSFALADEPEIDLAGVDPGTETASHREIKPLDVVFERLTALRLHPSGNLLACDGDARRIKVIDTSGKVACTIDLEFQPEAIDVAADGTIYCGGQGRLAKLDAKGQVLRQIDLPRKDGTPGEEKKEESGRLAGRENRVSGIAVTGRDVFLAYGAGWSLRSKSKLFRLDRDLDNLTLIAEGLRGCCQRCDITACDGTIYVAENARYRVVAFDREGEELGHWGGKGRKELDRFGSCCNPMNLDFDAKGILYTAESGLGRVKTYTADGEFLGLVGYIDVERFERAGRLAASCSNIAIAATPDAHRVYVMDYTANLIRVLEKKP